MNGPSTSAVIVLLALGLASAETGHQPRRWIRTGVTHSDGTAASTAFGPCQLTRTLARDIDARGMMHDAGLGCILERLYARVVQLGPGEEYRPTEPEKMAYWAACSAYWEHLSHKAEGDIELAAAMWRFGEYPKAGVDLKAKLTAEDPRYLVRFYEGI